MKQRTINNIVKISGIGVHNGILSTIEIMPALVDTGIVFINKKAPGEFMRMGSVVPEIAPHATVVRKNNWAISTIEHLMAALWALDIDNVVIEVDGLMTEIPILDGSAYPFIQALREEGVIVEQDALKKFITPKSEIRIDDSGGRYIKLLPAKNALGQYFMLHVDYSADFEHSLLGEQKFTGFITEDFFVQEISPARTFGFLEQLPMLRQHRLALGSSLGNSVVMGADGFLNEVRFDNEFVRHKVLDLIGDLALLGNKLIGSVQASKTGHSFNRRVIEHFINHPDLWEFVS